MRAESKEIIDKWLAFCGVPDEADDIDEFSEGQLLYIASQGEKYGISDFDRWQYLQIISSCEITLKVATSINHMLMANDIIVYELNKER